MTKGVLYCLVNKNVFVLLLAFQCQFQSIKVSLGVFLGKLRTKISVWKRLS